MARAYPYGYLNVSTSKYANVLYGDGGEYGINYPPPVPENLTVENVPNIVDQTPTFNWRDPTFGWDLPYGDADTITYEFQIAFNDSTFTSLESNPSDISAPTQTYTLAPEFELQQEGAYFARVRSTDGYTYSDWSVTLEFRLYIYGAYPPTIDTVTSPADNFWQVITGTKEPGVYIFVKNNSGEWGQATYTDGIGGTTWSFNLGLISGTNTIQAVSAPTTSTDGALSNPDYATIELIFQEPEAHNIWNHFDEFGLLLGLDRIPGEKNKQFKARLIDVYTNPANSTLSGLEYGISRELGVNPDKIRIEELGKLMDSNYNNNMLNSEGHALGTRLEDYAKEVHDNNPIFFGNIIADESYWDGIDEETEDGYSYLPHIWDPSASGVYDKWQSPGIGDNDDLYVKKLDEIWNPGISGYSWYMFIHTGYFYAAYPSGLIGV